MNDTIYLSEPVAVPNTSLAIVGISQDGTAYALSKRKVSGIQSYDLLDAFPLMPYLTRMAETGEDAPDYSKVQAAIQKARNKASGVR